MIEKSTTVEIADLANEYLERMRAGESPSLSEYEERYPQHAEEIRNVFPMMLLMEENAQPDDRLSEVVLKQLGDFRIVREIGRGGMGVVYEANQESLGRQVALKVFPKRLQLSSQNRERFRRESRAAAMLHHSNIVPVFAVGEEDGYLYYAMQYISGASLDGVIVELRRLEIEQPKEWTQLTNVQFRCNKGVSESPTQQFAGDDETAKEADLIACSRSDSNVASLPGQSKADSGSGATARYWSSVAKVGVQVTDALAYAHDHGTLHRDIKPGNLMLDEAGTVWVLDFGLAKSTLDEGLTSDGEMIGTLRYMSPEQCKGNADQRSDIYGVGMTLYEMLTLRPAYTDESRHELLRSIMEDDPTRPRKINPRIPRDLETIVLKAIEREPSSRYQTAQAFQDDLQRFLNGEPIDARPVGTAERVRKWVRRRPVVASLLAALATMFIVSFAMVTWNWRDAVAARSIAEDRETKATAAAKSEREARVVAASNLERAEDLLYSSQISRVQAIATTNPGSARMALDSLIPKDGQKDRRDWEWGYLNTLISQEISCFECGAPQAEFIWDLAFSHDDSLLAVCAGRTRFSLPNDGSSPKGRVTVWDTRSNELVCELPIERSGYAASFSHDSKRLVVSEPFTPNLWETEFHGPVQVWDIATKKPIVSLTMPKNHRANLLHFSNDDKFVFGTIWPQSKQRYAVPTAVVVWDATTGVELKRIPMAEFVETTDDVNVVILKNFRDGDRSLRPKVVHYDLETDKVISAWPQPSFSTDIVSTNMKTGAHVVSTGVMLTDYESGDSENLIGHDGHRPQNRFLTRGVLDFHPTADEMYVGASDGTVRIWSTAAQTPSKTLRGHDAPVNAVAVSHHGHMLASGDWNGQVRIWQPSFSSHLSKLFPRSERYLRPRFEAVGFRWGGAGVVAFEDGRLQTFEVESGKLLDERYMSGRALSGFRMAAFDHLGQWLGLIGHNAVLIYDVESGEVVCKTENLKDAHSICFAKDRPRFACATGTARDKSSSAYVFEIVDGEPVTSIVFEHDAKDFSIDSLSLDDAGDRIAIAGRTLDGEKSVLKIIVMDIASGQHYSLPNISVDDVDARFSKIPSVAFSPDGRRLATCTRSGIFAIFDLETKACVAEDRAAPQTLEDVSWNPAGTRIAGVNRETMVLWNEQGRVVLQMPREHRRDDLPFDPEVRFSPDGQRIVANMWDHTVKVWTSRIQISGDAEPESRRSSSLAVDSIKAAVEAHDNPWYLAHRGYLQHVDGNQAAAMADYLEAKKRLAGDDPCMLFAGPAYVTAPSIPFHELESYTVECWIKGWNSFSGDRDSRNVGQMLTQFPAPDRFGVNPKWYMSPAFKFRLSPNKDYGGEWIHLMATQDGDTYCEFHNGKRVRRRKAWVYAPNSERFHIADTIAHDSKCKGRGLMRAVHVSRGVLQTEDFTSPETIEPNDNSIFLYDFANDEALESPIVKDRSGNGNDGILHQAWWQK